MECLAKEAQWPDANDDEIRFCAWVPFERIRTGTRMKDIFVFGPNEKDRVELRCVVISVECGAFEDGEFIFRCRYTCRAMGADGKVIKEQTTLMGRDVEIALGDEPGIMAYFKSEEEAEEHGVNPLDLRPFRCDFNH